MADADEFHLDDLTLRFFFLTLCVGKETQVHQPQQQACQQHVHGDIHHADTDPQRPPLAGVMRPGLLTHAEERLAACRCASARISKTLRQLRHPLGGARAFNLVFPQGSRIQPVGPRGRKLTRRIVLPALEQTPLIECSDDFSGCRHARRARQACSPYGEAVPPAAVM